MRTRSCPRHWAQDAGELVQDLCESFASALAEAGLAPGAGGSAEGGEGITAAADVADRYAAIARGGAPATAPPPARTQHARHCRHHGLG